MIPFWFHPYALACGNTVVLKPSERVPLTIGKVFEMIDTCSFRQGLSTCERRSRHRERHSDHTAVRGQLRRVEATAKQVYVRAAAGKRAQCQGGAKNRL
jgi:malonate-semialdehyde dehydrogenase (acetylating)/methylmalonate-semialdehyde dehydrogenase